MADDLYKPVQTKSVTIKQLVERSEGPARREKEDVYEFGQGRTFKDYPDNSGIYNPVDWW